jgi:hypothetical protein
MCIMAATIRLCFGMARDNQLPAARHLARVHPKLHTPIWSCVVVAVIAVIPMLKYDGAGYVAIAATGMIYLAYFLGNLAVLWARNRGWPRVTSPFKLGRWGMFINIAALVYGGAMLINFAWPRAASNPEPNQTAGALSLGVGFLNKIPILYTVLAVILIIGVLYFFLVQEHKDLPPVHIPAESGPVEIPPESLPPEDVVTT